MAEDPKKNNPQSGDPSGGESKPLAGGDDPKPGADDNRGGAKTEQKIDLDAVKTEARQEVMGEVNKVIKKLFDVDDLSALEEKQLKEKGELEKLIERKDEELAAISQRYEDQLKRSNIMAAAAEAVDPEVVYSLLAGNAQVIDGKVKIDGKPADEAVKGLLAAKPYLAKASGKEGGGAGNAGGSTEKETLEAALGDARKSGDTLKLLEIKRKLAAIS